MRPSGILTFLVFATLCALISGTVAFSAHGTTYIVRPDGTGDFPTIQAAVDAAGAGDTIELTDGTFTGAGNREIDYLGKAISVASQSGNPAVCIIDCDGADGFLFRSGEGGDSVLRGVTVARAEVAITCTGASPTIEDCVFDAATGGAVVCSDQSAPGLSGCTFYRNTSADFEVAAGVTATTSFPTLDGCRFVENGMAGTMAAAAVRGRLGAIVTITDSEFVDNVGWGVIVFAAGAFEVSTSVFARNQVDRYVITLWDGVITGCTFVDNDAVAIIEIAEIVTTESNIIAFNDAMALDCSIGSTPVACCDIYANTGGDWVGCIAGQQNMNGNLSLDPLFCDAPAGDYSLNADSPCAPANSGACGLIGALPVECGPTAIDPATWGGIKEAFR